MELLEQIKEKAGKLQKRIVLAEGSELRTLKATEILLREKLAKIILLGDPQIIGIFQQVKGLIFQELKSSIQGLVPRESITQKSWLKSGKPKV